MIRELEICAETIQACNAASEGGADRIELCAALGEGGVTPSLGLLREALATVRIPLHVLVRPRVGGFVYSKAEFSAMCQDVQDALAEGAAGVVIGVVTYGQQIDIARTSELVKLAGNNSVTFHRAFDRLSDLHVALEVLIDLRCSRVLTSGGLPTVHEGLASLASLAKQADGRIRIAAGGGVTLDNASLLATLPGLDLHASLRRKSPDRHSGVDPLWKESESEISVESVRALSRIVHGDAYAQRSG